MLQVADQLYSSIVVAAPSSHQHAVAEAAKVIENTQRDANIALMNELSIIFRRLGIDTSEVLAAASTKWNFCVLHRDSLADTASVLTLTTTKAQELATILR